MSEIIKKQVVINRIKLPYEVLSVIKDYVFNDVEFLHDHYLNKEKGLFQKLNKCN